MKEEPSFKFDDINVDGKVSLHFNTQIFGLGVLKQLNVGVETEG